MEIAVVGSHTNACLLACRLAQGIMAFDTSYKLGFRRNSPLKHIYLYSSVDFHVADDMREYLTVIAQASVFSKVDIIVLVDVGFKNDIWKQIGDRIDCTFMYVYSSMNDDSWCQVSDSRISIVGFLNIASTMNEDKEIRAMTHGGIVITSVRNNQHPPAWCAEMLRSANLQVRIGNVQGCKSYHQIIHCWNLFHAYIYIEFGTRNQETFFELLHDSERRNILCALLEEGAKAIPESEQHFLYHVPSPFGISLPYVFYLLRFPKFCYHFCLWSIMLWVVGLQWQNLDVFRADMQLGCSAVNHCAREMQHLFLDMPFVATLAQIFAHQQGALNTSKTWESCNIPRTFTYTNVLSVFAGIIGLIVAMLRMIYVIIFWCFRVIFVDRSILL